MKTHAILSVSIFCCLLLLNGATAVEETFEECEKSIQETLRRYDEGEIGNRLFNMYISRKEFQKYSIFRASSNGDGCFDQSVHTIKLKIKWRLLCQ